MSVAEAPHDNLTPIGGGSALADELAFALETALHRSDQPHDRQLLAALDRWRAGDLT